MPAKKRKKPAPPRDPFGRRAFLAAAGTLLVGVVGGASAGRLLGGAGLAPTAAPSPAPPVPAERLTVVTPEELARAQAQSQRLARGLVPGPEAEGALPSVMAPPPQAPRVIAPPPESAELAELPAEPPSVPPAAAVAPQLPAQPRRSGTPWRDNALAISDPGARPKIAVVIDDVGVDRSWSQAMIALPGPLTISCMAYAGDPRGLANAVRAFGHETMLHLPMEPRDAGVDPGPGALKVSQPPDTQRRLLAEALERFPGVVGLNNHMGSRFTADAAGMRVVLEDMGRRGLMFLDSRTTDRSVAADLARTYRVPFAERAVFIDHVNDPAVIARQLAQAEQIAQRHGHAVAIGHPRPATHAALAQWLPTLAGRGIALIPSSAVIRWRA
ncbi:divergent polysaccharide deacetylase family protein [Pararhodospirillum photometricum]|nr:divergent polysaccharide deacetylase family protein [Pararhodospirillum photometricum]